MGISHKAVSSLGSSLRVNRAPLLESGRDDHSARRIPAPARPDCSQKEGRAIEQPQVSKALGEQILILYDEFRPRLFRYIRSMNLSHDRVQEVIQETFLRLTTQLMQEDDIENVPGWIVRVAHNVAVDMLKRTTGTRLEAPTRLLSLRVAPTLLPTRKKRTRRRNRSSE